MAELLAAREYNDGGCIVYAVEYPGAFARGKSVEEALLKLPEDVRAYCRFAGMDEPAGLYIARVVQEKRSDLKVCDADSDILLNGEIPPLTEGEYAFQKALCLKSAECFLRLYEAVPDKDALLKPRRRTFYGDLPATAREMYAHTNQVTSYYAGEIGAAVQNAETIVESRLLAFAAVEAEQAYLSNRVFDGSYGEQWTLRKVLRRFLWHDRIHAKALYRGACTLWGSGRIPNDYCF